MNFRKKGGYSNPKNFVADFSTSQKKRNIVFRNVGGGREGGSEAVWKFSENSLNLVQIEAPKLRTRKFLFQLFFLCTHRTAMNVLNYDRSLKSVAGLFEHLRALCILKGFLAAT